MKTYKTNNGNLVFNLKENELIYLKVKKEVAYNKGIFITSDAINKGIKGVDISNELILKAYEFLLKRQGELNKLNSVNEIELTKYKNYFGSLPQWVVENFKSENAYLKAKEKELIKNLQKRFKLKSQKETKEKIIKIYTVEYTGKNGGYRHFNRSISMEYNLIENISDYNRKRNLIITKLNGVIIEQKGNIDINEI